MSEDVREEAVGSGVRGTSTRSDPRPIPRAAPGAGRGWRRSCWRWSWRRSRAPSSPPPCATSPPASAASPTLAVATAASLAAFWRHEGRTPEPIVPPALWRDGLVVTANLATPGAGTVMIAVITFLPTYAQGVLGGAPTLEGPLAARVADGLAGALDLAFAVTAGVALMTLIVAFAMPDLDPVETG